MAGDDCLPMKMKRKGIDLFNNDFSDFSLSSPARKIRRLDADLLPIMEEEEAEIPTVKPVIEELETEPASQDRAIVLFKPVQDQQPCSGSLFVDTDLISGFKNEFLRSSYYNMRLADDDDDENQSPTNCCTIVPWVPSRYSSTQTSEYFQQTQNSPKKIQSDEVGDEIMVDESMEIDADNGNNNMSLRQDQCAQGFGELRGDQGLHQWQQPHCMIPQPVQNISPPVSWFR